MNQERVERLAELYAPTFACWDLLGYLHGQRPPPATIADLASTLARTPEAVGRAIDAFMEKGLVREKWTKGECVYSYTPNAEKERDVGELLEALRDHHVRLQLITQILRLNDAPKTE